ncbi:MAG: hypothetical protein ACC657_02775 [Thiohalomonadales bacterium]
MTINNNFFSKIKSTQLLSRLLNPYKNTATITLNGNNLLIKWTERANNKLLKIQQGLVIELQLSFACLVVKRVFFHENSDLNSTTINKNLAITFRVVQSSMCNTDILSGQLPTSKILTSRAARNMHPSRVQFDYCHNKWSGEYFI